MRAQRLVMGEACGWCERYLPRGGVNESGGFHDESGGFHINESLGFHVGARGRKIRGGWTHDRRMALTRDVLRTRMRSGRQRTPPKAWRDGRTGSRGTRRTYCQESLCQHRLSRFGEAENTGRPGEQGQRARGNTYHVASQSSVELSSCLESSR